jgi:uncharacterized protein DUF4242
VREFIGEHYLPAGAVHDAAHLAELARAAADELRQEGIAVRYVRSIFVPADETCMHVYRADAIEDVRAAAARASLHLDCLAEAVSDSGAAHTQTTARPALIRRYTP